MHFFKSATAFAVIFASAALCAEVFNLADSKNIRSAWGTPIQFSENQIQLKHRSFLVLKKKIDIDLTKKYSFKMTAVGNKIKPTRLYVGFDLCDDKGVSRPAYVWQGLQFTFTQLARDAKKGDTVIYVKNGRAWVRAGSAFIVKDAKADNSDIPNANVIARNVLSVKQENGVWAITLKEAVSEDLPANTNIRQHMNGGYYYCAIKDIPKDGEITVSGSISGLPKYLGAYDNKHWPIGPKKAYFIILADWTNTKTPVTLKDATFTIE